jgi:hypothetical protein
MLTITGFITPVRVIEFIPRECFCMLYAQWVNLFGMKAVLCLLPAHVIYYLNFGSYNNPFFAFFNTIRMHNKMICFPPDLILPLTTLLSYNDTVIRGTIMCWLCHTLAYRKITVSICSAQVTSTHFINHP